MSWLAEEVGRDARDDVSRGTCVKRAGFWRAVVKVRKLDDDGNTTWRQRMRNTGVPCSPDDDSGRDLASSAKEAWHDEILSSLVLDLAEKACDRRVEEAVSRAGSRHSEELRKPVVDYIREHVETQLAIGAIERSTARGYRDIVSRHIEPNLPEDRSVEEKPLSLSDAHDLLGTLSKMRCTPVVFAAELAIRTGVASGEICAVTWQQVRQDGFSITHAIGRPCDGAAYVKQPKTTARVHTIPMTEALRELFDRRREEARAAWEPRPSDYVIGHPDGSFLTPVNLSKAWTTLSRALDLKGALGGP